MKLNCDMGEACGYDAQLMPFIDMANIACGFHAGDKTTMDATVALAVQHNVLIGAHPGYADKAHFGRKPIDLTEKQLRELLIEQIELLNSICRQHKTSVHYIKPHGALYHAMMANTNTFLAIVDALSSHCTHLPLVVMANEQQSAFARRAKSKGISLIFEAFCDRAYDDHGQLAPRHQAGAILHRQEDIDRQIHALINQQSVTSINGRIIPIKAETICVHGDSQQAVFSVRAIRDLLNQRVGHKNSITGSP
ncbi:MAG: 5-oxoprolinase subunit PxpA [Pseudomonadota bacterium]